MHALAIIKSIVVSRNNTLSSFRQTYFAIRRRCSLWSSSAAIIAIIIIIVLTVDCIMFTFQTFPRLDCNGPV